MKILLCTVGGSHQPILKAIQAIEPDFVYFFCSPDTSESKGSAGQVTGEGNVIKASPKDDRPTLQNIPMQAGLPEDSFDVGTIPPDDLDQAFFKIRQDIVALTRRFAGARFFADYTGGTKTMTAALVLAAIESNDVELQIVTSMRKNLVGVKDGTEIATPVQIDRLRVDREMAACLATWQHFAYREAAAGLGAIRAPINVPNLKRLLIARELSHALADWDDFDHAGAYGHLQPIGRFVSSRAPWMLGALRTLTSDSNRQQEPARLHDLWLNAERRAAQGRFDDAVARIYRLIEWTAQWQLRIRLGIETAKLPKEMLPDGSTATPNDDGSYKVGLQDAWRVVRDRIGGPAGEFAATHGAELKNRVQARNLSILAHGFKPVTVDEWREMKTFAQERFLPVLNGLVCKAGLKTLPEQLPRDAKALLTED